MNNNTNVLRAVLLSAVVILWSVALGFTAVGTAVASDNNEDAGFGNSPCAQDKDNSNSGSSAECYLNVTVKDGGDDTAQFNANWSVADKDKDLAWVNLTLINETDNSSAAFKDINVSGENAGGNNTLTATGYSNTNYTVQLNVSDESGENTILNETEIDPSEEIDDGNNTESDNTPPTVKDLAAEDSPNSNFSVSWGVNDSDENLDTVNLTLFNGTGDELGEEATELINVSDSDGSASGTTWLNASDGGPNYTVQLWVNDTQGATNTSTILVNSTDDGDENTTETNGTEPTVDELSAEEIEDGTADAAFAVDWNVTDDDGLDTVNLTLTNNTGNGTEDTALVQVSGTSATNTTWLNASGANNTGANYTVELTVNDTEGLTNTSSVDVSENGTGAEDSENESDDGDENTPPAVENLSAEDDPNANFNVSWKVNDSGGDLAWANLTLYNGTDGTPEATANNSVGGSEDSGTSWLNGTDDNSTTNYTVELIVTDENGTSANETILVNETDEETENNTGSENTPPTVDELSAEEIEDGTADAAFAVDWNVTDDDGLDTVNLTLTNNTGNGTEDTALVQVSGTSATNTTWLNASGANNTGANYTVELTVNDTEGLTNSSSIDVSETGTGTEGSENGSDDSNTQPTVEDLSAEDSPNATFAVDWNVTDDDGLDTVNLTLFNGTGDDPGEEATELINVSDSDGSASNTTWLNATDGSGPNYTVELWVNDTQGATNTSTILVNSTDDGDDDSTDDGDENTTESDNTSPTVENLSAEDDPNAKFNVSWGVNDSDGDLAWTNLTLYNGTDDTPEDTANNSVGGSEDSGTSWLNGTDDNSTTNYTVELIVTDENGTSANETILVNETDEGTENNTETDGTEPTVDELSAEENETDDEHAEFVVDWNVSDDDGLDTVNVTLVDETDDETEERFSKPVDGDTANGTTRLIASDDNGSGHDYTVELVVTDENGTNTTETTSITADLAEVDPETGEETDESPNTGGGGGDGGTGVIDDDDTGDSDDADGSDEDDTTGGGDGGGADDSDADDATGGDGGAGSAGDDGAGGAGDDGAGGAGDDGAGGAGDDGAGGAAEDEESDTEENLEGAVSDGFPDPAAFQFGGNLMIVGATLALLALLLLLLLARRALEE